MLTWPVAPSHARVDACVLAPVHTPELSQSFAHTRKRRVTNGCCCSCWSAMLLCATIGGWGESLLVAGLQGEMQRPCRGVPSHLLVGQSVECFADRLNHFLSFRSRFYCHHSLRHGCRCEAVST